MQAAPTMASDRDWQGVGSPRGRWRLWLALLAVAAAAAGALIIYSSGPEDLRYDAVAFCRQVRRVEQVEIAGPDSPQTAARDSVRIGTARLVLLHEELAERAPESLQGPILEVVESYRAAVRSGSFTEVEAVRQSDAYGHVQNAIAKSCEEGPAGSF